MSNALFSDDKLSISRNICVLHSAFNMLSCLILFFLQNSLHVCASMAKVVCFYFKTISQKTCYSYDAYCCNLENCIRKCACVIFFRETFRSDYEALRERMTTLPDKTTHDVMVTGFHTKITSMLHMFLKKLTIQAHSIIL